jgi:hypothetical protein
MPGVFGLWAEVRESGAEYVAQIQLHRTANYFLRLMQSRRERRELMGDLNSLRTVIASLYTRH